MGDACGSKPIENSAHKGFADSALAREASRRQIFHETTGPALRDCRESAIMIYGQKYQRGIILIIMREIAPPGPEIGVLVDKCLAEQRMHGASIRRLEGFQLEAYRKCGGVCWSIQPLS